MIWATVAPLIIAILAGYLFASGETAMGAGLIAVLLGFVILDNVR